MAIGYVITGHAQPGHGSSVDAIRGWRMSALGDGNLTETVLLTVEHAVSVPQGATDHLVAILT